MPVDPRYNKTSYTPVYPASILDVTKHLKRVTTTTPDQFKAQAEVLNVLLLELQRVQEVLGVIPGWSSSSSFLDEISAIFGDGSDGSATITGGTTTLTSDKYYDDLTVDGTGVLDTAGYRVFVRGTLSVVSGGFIRNDGNAASETTPGALTAAATIGGGAAGGAVGVAGSNTTNSFGGAGGAGGDAGGSGGTATAPTASWGLRDWAIATTLFNPTGFFTGGAGGGGGTGASAGGGGGGAGVVMVAANIIVNNGTISAIGGVGGDAAPASGHAGGGGGGGGLVVLVTSIASSGAGSVSVAGGAAGLGDGAGGNGVAGSAGTAVTVILS